MKEYKMLTIILILLIAISLSTVVFATGNIKDLHEAHGIKVSDDGKLIDTYHNNEEIGNITAIESVDAGEKMIFAQDSDALQDVLSSDPLVTEYIVEGENVDGIYFMFGHDGDIFLSFVPTEKMGNGMLKRMTEFGEYQGVVK